MCSDFLVAHPSSPFLSLTTKEYKRALKKYPQLDDDTGIDYIERSPSASINLGADSYFDNKAILSQFERCFQMLQFKTEFKNHRVECLVDNATTHSVREFSINDFGKGSNARYAWRRLRSFLRKQLRLRFQMPCQND